MNRYSILNFLHLKGRSSQQEPQISKATTDSNGHSNPEFFDWSNVVKEKDPLEKAGRLGKTAAAEEEKRKTMAAAAEKARKDEAWRELCEAPITSIQDQINKQEVQRKAKKEARWKKACQNRL